MSGGLQVESSTNESGLLLSSFVSTPVAERAHVAQLVEHVLGKDEVTSSILVVGSRGNSEARNPKFENQDADFGFRVLDFGFGS